jgi:hypothetical protein
VHYDASGELTCPRHDDRADEGALVEHLATARALLAQAVARVHGPEAELPDELGHLQWFDLPAASLR